MSKNNPTYQKDLEDRLSAYVDKRLSGRDAHKLEREALDDPFLSDAMEGLRNEGGGFLSEDLQSLRNRLQKPKTNHFGLLKIAAAGLILLLGGYGIWQVASSTLSDQVITQSYEPMSEEKDESPKLLNKESTIKEAELPEQAIPEEQKPMASSEKNLTEDQRTKPIAAKPISKISKEALTPIKGTFDDEEPLIEEEVLILEAIGPKPIRNDDAERLNTALITKEAETVQIKGSDFTPIRDVPDWSATDAVARSIPIESKRMTHGEALNGHEPLSDVKVSAVEGRNVTLAIDRAVEGGEPTTEDVSPDHSPGDYTDKTVAVVKVEETTHSDVSVTDSLSNMDFVSYANGAPSGGKEALRNYVLENKRYPTVASQNSVEGIVTLAFELEQNGRPKQVTVLKSLGYGCDEEAIRLLLAGPDWKYSKGEANLMVSITFTFP